MQEENGGKVDRVCSGFARAFWWVIFIALALSVGKGPYFMDVARLSLIGMVLLAMLYPEKVSRAIFILSEITLFFALLVCGLLADNLWLILLAICLSLIVGIVFLGVYLERRFKVDKA